jgi:hypothetical protein
LELIPALRCNLFVFKEKTKRISTAIGAMLPQAFFCLDTKETKNQWPPDKKLKTTSQKRALAEPFALQALS